MRQIVDRLSSLLKDVDAAGLNDNTPVSPTTTKVSVVAAKQEDDTETMAVTEISPSANNESKQVSGPITRDQPVHI